jgi:NAD(P)-dependent dehydrogenase (short-subunit alcohol dehydrogenase family)
MSTPSQLNAQHIRDFVSTLHTEPYPAIDPSLVKLPSPYVVCIIGGRGAAAGGLARAYAQAGASGLILAARTHSALEETANEVRSINTAAKVVIAECDIASDASVESLAKTTKAEFDGHLDVVVVNAGYSGPMVADVVKESPSDFQTAFDVNTVGCFHAAHNFLPLLLATESGAKSFIGISSMAAPMVAGRAAHAHYCASKAAQTRLIEMINEQYANKGIFCASLHPGGLQSEFARKAVPEAFWSGMLPPLSVSNKSFELIVVGLKAALTDSPDLVGAFCLWLTKPGARKEVLNGRFLSCKWDVSELEKKFDEISEKDLLRFRIAVD